jgi:hypothetical protein
MMTSQQIRFQCGCSFSLISFLPVRVLDDPSMQDRNIIGVLRFE